MLKLSDQKFNRIIDANFNRAKEGLRVCEDVCRFILDIEGQALSYKGARHQLTEIMGLIKISDVILCRDVAGDVGRRTTASEARRRSAADIFYANSQRAKESLRVLEEFSKLRSQRIAGQLKRLRYKLYALEADVIRRCTALFDFGRTGRRVPKAF